MPHSFTRRVVAALPFDGALLLADATSLAQTIYYPSSALANPPQLAFPSYTPGGGSVGQTVRIQVLCSDSFLAAQKQTAGFVTKIGLSLAGQAVYDMFELRAGPFSRTFAGAVALPAALGGSCPLLVAPDLFLASPIKSVGGGLGTSAVGLPVPNGPLLLGTVLYTKRAQFDPANPATVPLTFSNSDIVVVH